MALVLTDAVSMVTSIFDWVSSSATSIVPVNDSKLPRTLEAMRWRATNPIRVWVGSIVQVPVSGLVRVCCVVMFRSY